MKRKLLLISMIMCFSITTNADVNKISNADNTMSQIKDNTKKTAFNTEKDYYYYLSVLLAFLSFVIATITLYYTRRTFVSQTKTQENTGHLITRDKQSELLFKKARELYHAFLKATVLRYFIRNNRTTHKVNDTDFVSSYINTSNILTEMYDKESEFFAISNLKSELDQYNKYLETVVSHLNSRNITDGVVYNEFDNYIIDNTLIVLKTLIDTYNEIYSKDNKKDLRISLIDYINKMCKEIEIKKSKVGHNSDVESDFERSFMEKKTTLSLLYKTFDTDLEDKVLIMAKQELNKHLNYS